MRISTGVGDLRRVVCSAADKNRLACDHGRSYDLRTIEQNAIKFVRDCFADPKRVQHFVKTFEVEYRAEQTRARGEGAKTEKRLVEVEGAIRRFVNALETGSMPESVIHKRLQELEAERVNLEERRLLADATIAKVSLHPAAVTRWHTDLCQLVTRLAEGNLPETFLALRNLLADVVVHPTKKKAPYQIETKVRLGALASDPSPAQRTPAEMAGEQGIAFSDSGNRGVAGLPISKNEKGAISLGIITCADQKAAA